MGFTKIELGKCQFYKDGRDFLRYAALEALNLKKENSTDNVKHKIALITSYTGLNFLLLSILQAAIPDENQRRHVIYKRQLKVKNSKLTVTDSTNTIDTEELIDRLKGCNFQMADIAPKLREIAKIRNNVIHHFENKPNEELLNHIITIFLIVNDIVNIKTDFWGDTWKDSIKISIIFETLHKRCIKSYEDNNFEPNTYYFNCPSCGSILLFLQKNVGVNEIKCETCLKVFDKTFLINSLTSSDSYRETHQVISLLSAFIDEFDEEDLEIINNADTNPQVGDIIFDDDINNFYTLVFGDEYFEN